MKKIGLIYEITNNPYFDLNAVGYSNRLSEFVYPSEINDICQALRAAGYQYELIDGAQGLINLIVAEKDFDLIFNKSIGFKGLERKIAVPAICQMYNLSRIGSGAYAMTLARHKYHTNRLLNGLGYKVPFACMYVPGASLAYIPSYPVIVKPNEESDSLGITENSVCFSRKQLEATIYNLQKDFNQSLIIEEYIAGEEWKVAVIGNKDNTHACGCVNSMKNGKTMLNTLQTRDDILKDTLSFVPVEHPLVKDALKVAEEIHVKLELNDYSRCDFRLGKDNSLYCMEVSTHPEISQTNSSFIEAAKQSYGDYNSVISKILLAAEERYKTD